MPSACNLVVGQDKQCHWPTLTEQSHDQHSKHGGSCLGSLRGASPFAYTAEGTLAHKLPSGVTFWQAALMMLQHIFPGWLVRRWPRHTCMCSAFPSRIQQSAQYSPAPRTHSGLPKETDPSKVLRQPALSNRPL